MKPRAPSTPLMDCGGMPSGSVPANRGLTVIFTGNGKGKTSAGMGVVFRALGHGYRCMVIQFIKANRETGELKMAERLAPQLEFVQTGKGFTWLKEHAAEEHRRAAQEGVALAKAALEKGGCKVLLLDEILYALGKNLVSFDDIKGLVAAKPAATHLILTGRGATPELIALADMVSDIDSVKHPYQAGIPAQKGLDF